MNNYDQAIHHLGKGFIKDFIDEVNADEALMEYMMDFAYKYVEENIPVVCLLYTSPSPRDMRRSRMPSSA